MSKIKLEDDLKMFDVKIENRVAAYKENGLRFQTYALVSVMMDEGTIVNYIVEGSGPTLHHSQQEFCEKLAKMRATLVEGIIAQETRTIDPPLRLVRDDDSA